MIGRNSMKHHYLKKKIFVVTKIWNYVHAKYVCKEFQIFVIQSNTLLLADVSENFRTICLEIYELDPAIFFSFRISIESSFKKANVKLDLLTDIDMLLMVEKGIRGGICQSIYRYAKANNKYMKKYDKNKESSYLQYWDVNNLIGWTI